MIDDTVRQETLSRILQSPEFKDSKRSQELLQYLVQSTLEQKNPKEITIAMEFLGKDASFDPKEDPTVRVQVNNLRKKLEHYYLTNTDHPPLILEIPKGHYVVQFRPVPKTRSATAQGRLPIIVLSALVVALSVAVALISFKSKDSVRPDITYFAGTPVWADYFKTPGKPTLIVLGDFFFLYERTGDTKPGNFVRNFNINSLDDFKDKVKQDPGFAERYVQSDFTFLRPSSSWGLAQILPVLHDLPNGYSLKLASQFTVDDFKANNIIFIGSFKTLYNLHKFLHIFGLEYTLSPNRFEIRSTTPDSTRFFTPVEIKGGNYEKDYAVVAKGTGPEGSTMLLLLGFSDSGVIEASRAVTDHEMIATINRELAHRSPRTPFHFTLVVETEGLNQAIFKSRVQYFIQREAQPDTMIGTNKDTALQN